MKKKYNVVIIGAGVAGITSAIYLKRANISCCIIEKEMIGGQINKTSVIENYPGIVSINGTDLSLTLMKQLESLEIPLFYENVLEIKNMDSSIKEVITKSNEYESEGIIIATGRRPKGLGLPFEEELTGKGISYCAFCDGTLYKEKTVAVIGGGNSAFEEAIYLSNLAKTVYLVHYKDTFKADSYLVKKAKQIKNIKVKTLCEVTEYKKSKDNFLNGLVVHNKKTNKKQNLRVDGCFLYIGHVPNTEMFTSLGILNDKNYIPVDSSMRTKYPLVYATGDVIEKDLYQIVTAVSEGAIAATTLMKDRNRYEEK